MRQEQGHPRRSPFAILQYNECGTTGTVDLLHQILTNSRDQVMLMGDFNLHHPAWGMINSTQDHGSDRLIELCDAVDLDLWLEPRTITRDQNSEQTTIDLSFGSPSLTNRLVACEIAMDCHADSDHLPIWVLVDIETPTLPKDTKRRLWKVMDTEKFDKFVSANLAMLQSRVHSLDTPRQIDDVVNHLINDIVQRGVQESRPWANPSQQANPSWTKDCGEAVKDSRRMFRRYLATHSAEDWETYRLTRNQKGRIIKKAGSSKRPSVKASAPLSRMPLNKALEGCGECRNGPETAANNNKEALYRR
jgi:hypothetical protein